MDANQRFFNRSQQVALGLAQADLNLQFGLHTRLVNDIRRRAISCPLGKGAATSRSQHFSLLGQQQILVSGYISGVHNLLIVMQEDGSVREDLMSRWTMPLECAAASGSAIWMARSRISSICRGVRRLTDCALLVYPLEAQQAARASSFSPEPAARRSPSQTARSITLPVAGDT